MAENHQKAVCISQIWGPTSFMDPAMPPVVGPTPNMPSVKKLLVATRKFLSSSECIKAHLHLGLWGSFWHIDIPVGWGRAKKVTENTEVYITKTLPRFLPWSNSMQIHSKRPLTHGFIRLEWQCALPAKVHHDRLVVCCDIAIYWFPNCRPSTIVDLLYATLLFVWRKLSIDKSVRSLSVKTFSTRLVEKSLAYLN